MRRLLVLLAALGVVAGCSTSIPGAPSPEAAPASTNSDSTGLSLGPRPREIELDGLDPCTSLSADQLAKLGLEILSKSRPTPPSVGDGRICGADGFETKKVSASIAFIYDRGIEAANTGPDAKGSEIESSRIAGFPGITARLSSFCAVDIDVATGQYIDIQYQDAAPTPILSSDQLCQGATAVGEEVMNSLGR